MNFTPKETKEKAGNTGYTAQKLGFDNRRPFNMGLSSQNAVSPMKMSDEGLKTVVKELKGAVKAHGNQAKIVQKHIDDMKKSPTKMIGGLKFDASKGWKKVKAYTTDSGVKGHFVTDPKGKKYFMTSSGKLHTGQIDDLKPESPNKVKGGVGEGFMQPPYKDTVKGTRPYAKRQGYHGYKNFTSNLASTDGNRKVMKDGPKTNTVVDSKIKNKIKGGVGNWQPHSQRSKK